jgi:hypothetical protein
MLSEELEREADEWISWCEENYPNVDMSEYKATVARRRAGRQPVRQTDDPAADWRGILDNQQADLAADEKRLAETRRFLEQQARDFPEMAANCANIIEASGRLLAERRAGLAEGVAEFFEETGRTPTLN